MLNQQIAEPRFVEGLAVVKVRFGNQKRSLAHADRADALLERSQSRRSGPSGMAMPIYETNAARDG
jgi:hypothetical protein